MTDPGGIGLALSGGAVRGIAHIAVLEVLEREGVPVKAVAGTSAGSIVGALYAAGMPLEEMKRVALGTSWKTFLRLTFPKRGLISSTAVYDFVKDLLPVKRFSSLKMPFAAVATDLGTGEKVVLKTGSLARAIQASCSLPVIFTPTVIGGRLLVDGGVASMVPVRTVREDLGADKVVAVNVNVKARGPERYDSLLKIATQVSSLWATRNAREEGRLADVLIPVNAAGIAPYDLSKGKEILRRGRRAAEDRLRDIEALMEGDRRRV